MLWGIVMSVVGAAVAVFLFWRFWFLRQPARTVPRTGIVSPADGKLIRIIPFTNGKPQEVPKGLLGKVTAVTKDVARSGYVLVIMLTPLDVHYQRAPIAGEVVAQLVSVAVTAALHLALRQPLLSIAGGTGTFMVLTRVLS